MSAALSQILTIFLAILAGFVCRKLGVLSEESTSALSNIVVKIILPFYLFSAILRTDVGVEARAVPLAVGLSAGMFLLSALVALIVVPLLRVSAEDRGVYLFELMCGNVTYIGIPVCAAVLGGSASFYASLLNIPYNLICFSLGIFLLAGKFSFKKILNPAFLAGLAAAILYMLRVKLPAVLLSGCAFLGQATSPCAMLVIGSVLAGVPIREIFSEWRAVPFVLLRLFGIAALTALLLKPLSIDPVLKGVLILMAAMPAATNSTMLCTIYGGNRALSAKLIFLSTALSLASIPLWAALYFS
ncbi:MAG: AEC family transporter [Oscillospiraceae bacterium]|nr:AEC family transporter [Oscillospiraceae bacterium]